MTNREVRWLMECRKQPIRSLDISAVLKYLAIRLRTVAKAYGARMEIDEETLTICQELILEEFKNLGIDEIEKAYFLWSAGKLETYGAEMFGGQFSAAQLGKVLAAYEKRRKKIVAQIIIEQEKMREMEQKAAKIEKLKGSFEANLIEAIEKGKLNFVKWEQIPVWWWASIKERGWVKFERGEAMKIFVEAQGLAKQKKIENSDNNKFARLTNRFDNIVEFDLKSQQRNIAGQLTIWKKIINNPDWVRPNQ